MKHHVAHDMSAEVKMPRAWIGCRRRALVVGINTYICPALENLKGSTNDAMRLGALLDKTFDFGVVRLCDSAATRQAIIGHLAALTNPCDEVVFCFSGHGSRIFTPDHGPFETLVPYDSHRRHLDGSQGGANRDITDREIYGWVLRAAQKVDHVTLIIDACRAGGIVRDLEAQPRGVLPDSRLGVLKDKIAFLLPDQLQKKKVRVHALRMPGEMVAKKRWLPPSNVYTLLGACRDRQLCYEMEDPETGQIHGIFSLFLAKALLRLHKPTSWRELRDHIARRIQVQNPDQAPQLEGAVDQEIFGSRQLRPDPFLTVVECEQGEVLLDGGAARGLVLGSTWRLFPSSALRAEGQILGTIRIVRMTATQAWGQTLVDELDHNGCDATRILEVKPGCRAFEVERPLKHRLRVLIDPSGEVGRRELERAVEKSAWLASVNDPEQADVVLPYLPVRASMRGEGPVPALAPLTTPHWALVDPAGQRQLAPTHDTASRPARPLAVAMVADLERLARQRFLKAMTHPEPERSLTRWVQVEMLHRVSEGDWKAIEPGTPLSLGVRFALRLHRRPNSPISGQGSATPPIPIYVAAIDLGLSGSVRVFYPRRGRRIAWRNEVLEIGLRPDDALHIVLPQGFPYPGEPPFETANETVLLLFSLRFTDFDALSQSSIGQTRSDSDSPVFGILERTLGGLPQRSGASENLLSHPDQWGLLQCPFQVVKAER